MKTLRLLGIAVLALSLAACGFRPLYGRYGANPGAQRIFSSVYVEPIALENAGYALRNSLIDLLEARAAPAGATYRLAVTLKEQREGAVLQNEVIAGTNETSVTRYNYTLEASFVLTDAKGTLVTKGEEATLSAYNVVTSPYATQMAQQDARQRAANDIAQRIMLDLGVFFARRVPQK